MTTTTKTKLGRPRRQGFVTPEAERKRRYRERLALARRGPGALEAGGPTKCQTCGLELATTPEAVYFDDPCGASCWAVGVQPTSYTLQRALDLGHTQAELDAAEAAPVEAA